MVNRRRVKRVYAVVVTVGMFVNVRYMLGGVERLDAAEIYRITPSGYCYVRRIDAGWLGVSFALGDMWPLKAGGRDARTGYQLEPVK